MAGRHVLQAVALLHSGVSWIDQRHAALCPQLLDLIKLRSDVGGFLGRDAPMMGQAPLMIRSIWATVVVGWQGDCRITDDDYAAPIISCRLTPERNFSSGPVRELLRHPPLR
jgi:hypothetical protein